MELLLFLSLVPYVCKNKVSGKCISAMQKIQPFPLAIYRADFQM